MSGLKNKFSYRATFLTAAFIGMSGFGFASGVTSAVAQDVIGSQPGIGPICDGPRGPDACAVVLPWMNRNMPDAFLPRDGRIVADILRKCGGEPRCTAASWASVEVQRCRDGFGVQGGCFGPNGEIMKVINRFVPQHLQPNRIIENMQNDIQHGPGDNNDLVGKNGWLRKRLGL